MLLEHKVVLITGAASGIGEATARLCIEEGAAVWLADLNEEKGVVLARALGDKAAFTQCDVTDEQQVASLVDEVVERYHRLDCAVNNAGISGSPDAIENISLENWQQVMNVNLTSVFLCLKHELKQMQRQGSGAIVNISSESGLIGEPNMAGYCATKHGVLGLSKTAALENVKNGIRVNAVLPGSVRTPMLDQFLDLGPDVEKMILESVPCGRFGQPEEIAQNVVWLCSDRASYVSGSAMSVDYANVCR
ncbi:MAG: glucose 1-dehydrogenase [Halieaceae bacterium]|nr:glucose 1-dehydrogenase [Halieaceae bacterium]